MRSSYNKHIYHLSRTFILLLLIRGVSLQEIEAVVGDTVILPCSNSDKKLQDTSTVFWRYSDSINVYDIINSRALFEYQDESFRGRVTSFLEEWPNGNFSIELSNVKKADTGLYSCFIPSINSKTEVALTVKDRPHSSGPDSNSRNSDVKRRPDTTLLFFAFLLGCSLLYT